MSTLSGPGGPVGLSVLGLGALLGLGGAARRGGMGRRRPRCRRDPLPLAGVSARGTPVRGSTLTRRAMFDRFSTQAMRAILLASQEAKALGHGHVGTEMILVGIVAEGADAGAVVLRKLGVDAAAAHTALEDFVGRGPGATTPELPFTTGAKQVLEDAVEGARREVRPVVTTRHLLQAMLGQEEAAGARLLGQLLGCRSCEEVCDRVLPMLAQKAADQYCGARQRESRKHAKSSPSSSPSGQPRDSDLETTMKYAQDLTALAAEGRLEPLIGREQQLERTVRILGRRLKNNPVFVGEPGVGKTSIAHGLAERIARGKVPPNLLGKRVLQLDLAQVLAGARYRGDFEERLRTIVREVTASNRQVILVIDEIHSLVGAGGADGSGLDAANLLKPALARGELQCMGATTLDEYRQYIERDAALERRFQPVLVPEPSEQESERILAGLAQRYERHHQLRYMPEALRAAVQLASRYISDRYFPDKAIDVMDEAGSRVRQQCAQAGQSAECLALEGELEEARLKKNEAVAASEFREAQRLKAREVELRARLEALRQAPGAGDPRRAIVEEVRALQLRVQEAVAAERFDEAARLKARTLEVKSRFPVASRDAAGGIPELQEVRVTEADVAAVVAAWTGIAVEQVSADESARLMRLEEVLRESVIGQDQAVRAVASSLHRARVGLRDPKRPIASFMFSGPTGVGKTQLCKTLSSTFFGSEEAMIRLGMSEFMEKHTVSKLVGAPPGYVGYSEGSALTETVRRKPYSLMLFDEVEKAHPDVFNMLLQLLDDGRLTDSRVGRSQARIVPCRLDR